MSTAPGYKSQPLEGFPGLLDVVLPSVLKHRQMALIAVGTPPDEAWAKAQEQAGGRLAAVGTLTDWSRIMQAADIYVDSIPVAGTSMLEAAASGLPPVSVAGFSGECILFSCNSPGLERGRTVVGGRKELAVALDRLVTDRDFRLELGQEAREAVLSTHNGHRWYESLHCGYSRAAVAGRIQMNELVPEAASPGYNRMLLAFNHNAGLVVPLANVIAGHPLQLGALMGPAAADCRRGGGLAQRRCRHPAATSGAAASAGGDCRGLPSPGRTRRQHRRARTRLGPVGR